MKLQHLKYAPNGSEYTRNANVRRNDSKFIRNGFDKLEMILN